MDEELSRYENLINEFIPWLRGTVDRPAFTAMGVTVDKMEQYEGNYDKLNPGEKPRISIGWLQDRFGTDENDSSVLTGAAAMEPVIYFHFSITARSKFGKRGGLNIIDKVQQLMLGFKSAHFRGEAYAFAASVQNFNEGVWYYRVIIRWKYLHLEPLHSFRVTGEEDLGGVLVESTFEPEFP